MPLISITGKIIIHGSHLFLLTLATCITSLCYEYVEAVKSKLQSYSFLPDFSTSLHQGNKSSCIPASLKYNHQS